MSSSSPLKPNKKIISSPLRKGNKKLLRPATSADMLLRRRNDNDVNKSLVRTSSADNVLNQSKSSVSALAIRRQRLIQQR